MNTIEEIAENLNLVSKQFDQNISDNIVKIERAIIEQQIEVVRQTLITIEEAIKSVLDSLVTKLDSKIFTFQLLSPSINDITDYKRLIDGDGNFKFSQYQLSDFNESYLNVSFNFGCFIQDSLTVEVKYNLIDKYKLLNEIYYNEVKTIPKYLHSSTTLLNDKWVKPTANYLMALNKIKSDKKVDKITLKNSNNQCIELYLNNSLGENLFKYILSLSGIRV